MRGTKVFSYMKVTERTGDKMGKDPETARGGRNLDGEGYLGKMLSVRGFVIAFFFFCKTEAQRNSPLLEGFQTSFFGTWYLAFFVNYSLVSFLDWFNCFPILRERYQGAKQDKHIQDAAGQRTCKSLRSGEGDAKYILELKEGNRHNSSMDNVFKMDIPL